MSDHSSRVLWRETKKVRRLRRYESLPVAHIVPEHRPLFVCQACKFSNTLIQTCPWCTHPCNALFVETAIRRRISAPQMLNDCQKDQLQRIQVRACNVKSSTVATVAAFDITMPNANVDGPSGSRRRRHRDAMAYTINVSLMDDTIDEDDGCMSPCSEHGTISSAGRSAERKLAADNGLGHSRTLKSTLSKTPSRTLRHKKRMSVIRQRSSCSLRRRAMLSLPPSLPRMSQTDGDAPTLPRKPSQTRFSLPLSPTSLPTAPSIPLVSPIPLGHPSRPLYSAIRKNMSRPSTPNENPPPSQAGSPTDLRDRGMRSLDLPHSSREFLFDEYLSVNRPWPVRPISGSGFSLSGEIELRMALARGYTSDSDEIQIRPASRLHEKRDLDVKGKVKRIGKGLKDLVMLRI